VCSYSYDITSGSRNKGFIQLGVYRFYILLQLPRGVLEENDWYAYNNHTSKPKDDHGLVRK
jgi:hypothetical protein